MVPSITPLPNASRSKASAVAARSGVRIKVTNVAIGEQQVVNADIRRERQTLGFGVANQLDPAAEESRIRCTRAGVAHGVMMVAIATVSALTGTPESPRREATSPSCAMPPCPDRNPAPRAKPDSRRSRRIASRETAPTCPSRAGGRWKIRCNRPR